MATVHIVKQGEHLSGIAHQYGFRRYETIWNHANNAALRDKRKLPHVLFPGDQVFIPDKREKTVSCVTTKVHRFQVHRQRMKLRIALLDFDNQPIANTDCELNVEGAVFKLRSNRNGIIEAMIPRTARTGTLLVPDLDIESPVQIGHLDPVEQDSGWQARLIHLGYYAPLADDRDPERLRYAIEEFQCDHRLPVTGELDAATKAKLNDLHGA